MATHISNRQSAIDGQHVVVEQDTLCEMRLPFDEKTGAPIIANRVVKHLDRTAIVCDQCRMIATPAWERPRLTPTLMEQIQADMRRRYGPSIEDPEWATEGFVPR